MNRRLTELMCVVLVVLFLTSSCTQDEPMLAMQNTPCDMNSSHKLSVNDALKRAYPFLLDVSDPKTRTENRTIESVECIKNSNAATRSDKNDTLLYLVNFSNEEGFILMTADDRLCLLS